MKSNKRRLLIIIAMVLAVFALLIFVGCTKEKIDEEREEEVQKLLEEFQEKYDERMLEEAEKRGIKEEVLEIIEKREERERKRKEKEEKEIRKILGEPGKPIEDKYLEELFAPEFPYEGINIVEKADGSRYIIIDAENKIKQKQKNQYVFETLLGRGVSVYRIIDAHTGTVDDFILTIVKKTETPGVIEYSEDRLYTYHKPEGYKYYVKEGLREALRFKGDKIIIEISPEFGHKFKRKVIYPKNDVEGPEPQDVKSIPENITRYPNSKRIGFYKEKDGDIRIHFVTNDPIEKVIEFYVKKKKEYYDNNPHMRKRPFYRQGSEEFYILTHLQPYTIFGIKDIGGGILNFSILDNRKHVYIDIKQSENVYLKNYVEIIIRGND